jgi:hypothetical protein
MLNFYCFMYNDIIKRFQSRYYAYRNIYYSIIPVSRVSSSLPRIFAFPKTKKYDILMLYRSILSYLFYKTNFLYTDALYIYYHVIERQ